MYLRVTSYHSGHVSDWIVGRGTEFCSSFLHITSGSAHTAARQRQEAKHLVSSRGKHQAPDHVKTCFNNVQAGCLVKGEAF